MLVHVPLHRCTNNNNNDDDNDDDWQKFDMTHGPNFKKKLVRIRLRTKIDIDI